MMTRTYLLQEKTRSEWQREYGEDRSTWPKQPVAGKWPEPKKGRVMLGGRLPQDVFGFDAPKKRPDSFYASSQPDPRTAVLEEQVRSLQREVAASNAITDTLVRCLGQREEFADLARAVEESRRTADEERRRWAELHRTGPGSSSLSGDPTDGSSSRLVPPAPDASRPPRSPHPQQQDDDDTDQYLNLDDDHHL